MTQQPYGFPFQQPQQSAQQPAYPQPTGGYGQPAGFPQQGYAQPQGYPPPQQSPYGPVQQYGYAQQPPVPQGPAPVAGTLDAFNSQPMGGGGPGLSFKDAPLGHTYTGTVTRDVVDADVQQDSDPKTKALKTYRDGRPQLVMGVPVQLDAPDANHPDGRATLYVRSGVRDAMAAAMSAAGITDTVPKAGDRFQLTLVERKQTGQAIAKSIYAMQYARGSQVSAVTGTPSPAPTQPQAPQPPVQVPEQPQAPAPQPDPWAAGQAPQPQAPAPQPAAQVFGGGGFQGTIQQGAAPQPQALPAGVQLTPEQQALFARIAQQG